MSRKGKKPNPRRQWHKTKGIKSKWLDAYYSFIFLLGIALLVWEIDIYRITIIPVGIPIMIMVAVGFFSLPFEWKRYGKAYDGSGFSKLFYSYMICLFGWGGIVCAIFMLTNYYHAAGIVQQEKFQIISRSSMSGGKGHRNEPKPLFRINYHGQEKELVFGHQFYEAMEDYKSVELTTQKGYLGYPIIKDKALLPLLLDNR